MVQHIKITIIQYYEKESRFNTYFPQNMLIHYEDGNDFQAFDSWAKKEQDWRAAVKLFKFLNIDVKKPKEPLVNELLIMDILSQHGYEVIALLESEEIYEELEKKRSDTKIYFRKKSDN